MKNKSGFTLVELLVVIAILSLLATVGFGQYRTSQKKASDAQRKADLGNIARAIEMYYNDNGSYPVSSNGLIDVGAGGLDWGGQLIKTYDTEDVIYMKSLPVDPADNQHYCYESTDGGAFRIFAVLENENDLDIGAYACSYGGVSENYSYGISSSNINLTD